MTLSQNEPGTNNSITKKGGGRLRKVLPIFTMTLVFILVGLQIITYGGGQLIYLLHNPSASGFVSIFLTIIILAGLVIYSYLIFRVQKRWLRRMLTVLHFIILALLILSNLIAALFVYSIFFQHQDRDGWITNFKTKWSCDARGDRYYPHTDLTWASCERRTQDGGKPCRSNQDCETFCLLYAHSFGDRRMEERLLKSDQEGYVLGSCAATATTGRGVMCTSQLVNPMKLQSIDELLNSKSIVQFPCP